MLMIASSAARAFVSSNSRAFSSATPMLEAIVETSCSSAWLNALA